MRRLILIPAVVVSLVIAAQPAEAGTLRAHASCPTCGWLSVDRNSGWIGQTASAAVGSTFVSVAQGRIWVRDNTGRGQYTLGSHGRRTWVASRRAWRITGRNLQVSAWGGRWWVRAVGTGISVSTVAHASVRFEGRGGYSAFDGRRVSGWWSPYVIRRLLIKE